MISSFYMKHSKDQRKIDGSKILSHHKNIKIASILAKDLSPKSLFELLLSQWLTFKLLGITLLVGRIKFKLLFHGPKWLSESLVRVGLNMNNLGVTPSQVASDHQDGYMFRRDFHKPSFAAGILGKGAIGNE